MCLLLIVTANTQAHHLPRHQNPSPLRMPPPPLVCGITPITYSRYKLCLETCHFPVDADRSTPAFLLCAGLCKHAVLREPYQSGLLAEWGLAADTDLFKVTQPNPCRPPVKTFCCISTTFHLNNQQNQGSPQAKVYLAYSKLIL